MKKMIVPILISVLMLASCKEADKDYLPMPEKTSIKRGEDPSEDRCECPMSLLFHKKQISRQDDWDVELHLPSGEVQLLPKGKLLPSLELDIGDGKAKSKNSESSEEFVEPGSLYEAANVKVNLLCGDWKMLCISNASNEKMDNWWVRAYQLFGIKTSPPLHDNRRPGENLSPKSILQGLSKERKTATTLQFNFGYSGQERARLQVILNYKDRGKWVRLHREDLLFLLPGTGSFFLDLSTIQFGQTGVPNEWDYEIRLLLEGRFKTIRSFVRGKRPT